MSFSTLGSFSFSVRPFRGEEFHLTTYVNASSDGKIFEFSCRYSPLPGESYDYFISTNYRITEISREIEVAGRYDLDNSVMLRGTIDKQHAANVLRRVSNDLDRVTEVIEKTKRKMLSDSKALKESLSWYLRSLEKEDQDINIALRGRDFIVVIEVLTLCLLGSRHPDPEIGKLSDKLLGAVFPCELEAESC